ncbi:HU family DNA-binding protein [Psychromarinibacter sp. S121]|uniref:HU family DNA-binding protein n=1 Tax=Psychromarinibacter sp. S121 TaxID=3415127 RepID=UPI003C7E194E
MAAGTTTRKTTKSSVTDNAPADAGTGDDTGPVKVLGKRELLERVVLASGIKKRAAKPVVEAMLKELGDAFARGDTVNLQPFGKGIVKSVKDLENAEVVELRLRRSKVAIRAAESGPKDPLAEAAE